MIRPIGQNILVKLKHRESSVGLTIPDKAKRWQEKTLECEVVSIGPYVRSIEVGEVVMIEGHSGKWIDQELTDDPTETYRMIDRSDVIAILDPVQEATA